MAVTKQTTGRWFSVFFLPGPCLAEVHHANRGCDAKQSSGSVWMVGAFLKEDLQHLSRVRGGQRESELLSQEFSEGRSRNGSGVSLPVYSFVGADMCPSTVLKHMKHVIHLDTYGTF